VAAMTVTFLLQNVQKLEEEKFSSITKEVKLLVCKHIQDEEEKHKMNILCLQYCQGIGNQL
jgi:hypothetical protein